MSRPSIQILAAVAILDIASIGIWYGVMGLLNGAVQVVAKHDLGLVRLAESPVLFCLVLLLGSEMVLLG
jgi:hypothetical protein